MLWPCFNILCFNTILLSYLSWCREMTLFLQALITERKYFNPLNLHPSLPPPLQPEHILVYCTKNLKYALSHVTHAFRIEDIPVRESNGTP